MGIYGTADRVAAMVRVEGQEFPLLAAHGAMHGLAELGEVGHARPLCGRNRHVRQHGKGIDEEAQQCAEDAGRVFVQVGLMFLLGHALLDHGEAQGDGTIQ